MFYVLMILFYLQKKKKNNEIPFLSLFLCIGNWNSDILINLPVTMPLVSDEI